MLDENNITVKPLHNGHLLDGATWPLYGRHLFFFSGAATILFCKNAYCSCIHCSLVVDKLFWLLGHVS